MLTIKCVSCGRIAGVVEPVTRDTLAQMAKGSPFAGMLALVPADFMETVIEKVPFTCAQCCMRGKNDNGKEAESGEETALERYGQGNAFGETSAQAVYREHSERIEKDERDARRCNANGCGSGSDGAR